MNLQDYIFPFPALYNSSKIINKKICNLKEANDDKPYCYEYASSNENINADILSTILKDTIENKKILEDKAKSTLIAITISSTLIVNILNFLKNINGDLIFLTKILAIIGVLCVFYMLIAGVLSLYSISEINTVAIMFPDDYLLPDIERKLQIADNIEYNYLNNLKRNNFMTTSYKCMISSLSLLLIIFIILTFSFVLEKDNIANQGLYKDSTDLEKTMSKIVEEYVINKQSQIILQQEITNLFESDKVINDKIDVIMMNIESIYTILRENLNVNTNEIKD